MTQTVSQIPVHSPRVAEQPAGALKFAGNDDFQAELRRRVEEHFRGPGRRERDCWQMYLKTTIVLLLFAAAYLLLVFVTQTWWQAVPLIVLLGLGAAGIGFNIQHDGGHHAYSSRPWINKLMAMSLDLLGGSSYVWARKHNTIHHTYANITGHDDDVNIGVLGRLSPHQPRRVFHRLQQYYLWAFYGLLPVKWQVWDDFRDLATGKIGGHRFARPKGWNLVAFILGKVVFFSLALAVPLFFHPWWVVLVGYLAVSWVQGVTLSVVFQLAHCVEEAAFPMPRPGTGQMDIAWARHQVETTVDFARGNRALSWLIGGLNFQIEHHLFPRICHVNYPALSKLVEATCRDFAVEYKEHTTLGAGLASHFRWLRRMGRAETAARGTGVGSQESRDRS